MYGVDKKVRIIDLMVGIAKLLILILDFIVKYECFT
jgi:hypothetical protein